MCSGLPSSFVMKTGTPWAPLPSDMAGLFMYRATFRCTPHSCAPQPRAAGKTGQTSSTVFVIHIIAC